jgi:hypothetical protein
MREPPKLASYLLRTVSDAKSELVGDLFERYQSEQSAWWFWREVLAVVGRAVLYEVRASIGWSAVAITAAVLALDLPLLFRAPVPFDARRWLLMAFYLVPQAIVIAVPAGLTVGMVIGAPSRVSPSRILPVVLLSAVLLAVTIFEFEGWVVPASNQAYRVTVAGPNVARGAGELTVVQLHSLMSARDTSISELAPISTKWDVAVNYYVRFALPCSVVAFPLFGVWATTFSQNSRRLLVLATASAYIACFYVIDPQQVRGFSPFLVAWWPTLSIAAVALLVRWHSVFA